MTNEANVWTLHEAFIAYAKFGDEHRNKGLAMCMNNSLRWLRAAHIPELVNCSEFDLKDLLFQITNPRCVSQIPGNTSAVLAERSANLAQFNIFIDILAKLKNVNSDRIRMQLRSCGPPHHSMDVFATVGVHDLCYYLQYTRLFRQ